MRDGPANFALAIDVDGRKRPLRLEPVGEQGGFDCVVFLRDGGLHVRTLTLTGRADHGGRLMLRVFLGASVLIWRGGSIR